MSLLDQKISPTATVADAVLGPLAVMGPASLPRIIDVGARNGMHMLPAVYCKMAEMVGFEPNPEEFDKLTNGQTDAMKAGMKEPHFRSTRYFPYAVWDKDDEAKFYITVGAGACTMMGETDPIVGNRMYKDFPASDPRSGKSFLQSISHVKEVIPVPCKRLDSILNDGQYVDLLKLDVEGGELKVLQGAEKILNSKKILFIFAEFQAVQYYKEHPMFGDQHVFLRDKGFRLIGINSDHALYARDSDLLGAPNDRPMLQAGDAIFMLDPDRNALTPEERQRMAAMAFCFGFNSLGVSLLREAGLTSEQNIAAIRAAMQRLPFRRRLRRAWENFPTAFAEWLYSFEWFKP